LSGETKRSLAIIILPLMFLLGLVILIVTSPIFSQISIFSGFNFGGINEGIAQILPLLGVGLGIAMLFVVFCAIRRARR
jgi:uncharacterized membrane protein